MTTNLEDKQIKKTKFSRLKSWLGKFSFKTGAVILCCAIPLYIISFAQAFLPISTKAKGILWVIFFGLAKLAQYTGLTILGAEGIKRIKKYFKKNKDNN